MIYVLSYDRPFGLLRSNEEFLGVIRSLGTRWIRPMERVWLIDSGLDPQEMANRLGPYLTAVGDRLIISPLTGSYYGWLPQEAWDWVAASQQGRWPTSPTPGV